MAQGRGGLRRGLIIGGTVFLALFLAAVSYWRADILQAALDPKKPFQTYTPPKAPNYAKASSWALIPDRPLRWSNKDLPADVFFVHPTSYLAKAHWNAPLGDNEARTRAVTFIRAMASPFAGAEQIWAPRYRQAAFGAFLTPRRGVSGAGKSLLPRLIS